MIAWLGILQEKDSTLDISEMTIHPYLRTDDIDENPNQKITIEFKENKIITSRLSPEGELIQKSGSHYNHEGHFLNFDNIEFTITGLGGLGYGTNYYVKGVRK